MDGLAHGGVARKMRHNTSFVGLGQQNGLASQEALAHAIPWRVPGGGAAHRYERRIDLRPRREPQGAPSDGPTRAMFVGPAWFVGQAMMSWIWTWAGRVAAYTI